MGSLPFEIYKNTFLYLERKDLQTCYFVCKNWYSVAIPLSWENVLLESSKIALLKSHLNNFNYGKYFKYGHLIKKLTIEDVDKFTIPSYNTRFYIFSEQELLDLLNKLPNLNEINLRNTIYLKEYLEFLLKADIQHIKKINTGGFEKKFVKFYPNHLYFPVCYKFRNTISSMSLNYSQETYYFNTQQIDAFHSLTQFKQLTQLEFYNANDINLTPFHIQNNCPNLKYLKFFSNHPISESVMLDLTDQSSRIKLSFISSLTCLDLFLPSLSTTYTRYLVYYLPNQIIDFSIRIFNQCFFNWIDIVGMEIALGLMETMGKIEKTYITFRGYNRYEVQTNEETKITKYFKLLKAFRGTRQSYYTANFSELRGMEESDYFFRYSSRDNLFSGYSLDDDGFEDSSFDLHLPCKINSIIFPGIFDALEFNFRHKFLRWDTFYRTLNYYIVNCPQLRSFKIKFNGINPHSISYKHKDNLISNQTNTNINFLQMEHTDSAQYYFNLVKANLCHIEVISLTTKSIRPSYNDLVIDLTEFKKLKTFIYIFERKRHCYFIFLKYTNGVEQYYYPDEGKGKNSQIKYTKDSKTFYLTIICDASVSFDFRHI